MGKQKKKQNVWQEMVDMDAVTVAADRFKALGDPTRLGILQFLIWSEAQPKVKPEADGDSEDEGGVTIGEIARFLTGDKEITSIISHHIKELRQAGLIVVERDGKKKRCYLSESSLLGLIQLLGAKPMEGCCARDAEAETPADSAEVVVLETPETVDLPAETDDVVVAAEESKPNASTKRGATGRRRNRKEPQPKLTEANGESRETL